VLQALQAWSPCKSMCLVCTYIGALTLSRRVAGVLQALQAWSPCKSMCLVCTYIGALTLSRRVAGVLQALQAWSPCKSMCLVCTYIGALTLSRRVAGVLQALQAGSPFESMCIARQLRPYTLVAYERIHVRPHTLAAYGLKALILRRRVAGVAGASAAASSRGRQSTLGRQAGGVPGTQFTCFTGTKAQILTPVGHAQHLLMPPPPPPPRRMRKCRRARSLLRLRWHSPARAWGSDVDASPLRSLRFCLLGCLALSPDSSHTLIRV
jgi:hypothetical protein